MSHHTKTAMIRARVSQDDRDWLEREAERIGLDPSSFIRMTLKRERNEREAVRNQQMAVA
jgi:antitoxin component of RelBE/YafQ-DinJ toxin-antitoxin module